MAVASASGCVPMRGACASPSPIRASASPHRISLNWAIPSSRPAAAMAAAITIAHMREPASASRWCVASSACITAASPSRAGRMPARWSALSFPLIAVRRRAKKHGRRSRSTLRRASARDRMRHATRTAKTAGKRRRQTARATGTGSTSAVRDGMAVRSGRGMRNTGRRRTNNASQWAGRLAAVALRHPGAMLGALIFTAALTAVSVNALTLQSVPHPAALFSGTASPERVTGQVAPPTAPPVVPPRLQAPVDAANRAPAQSAPAPQSPAAAPPARQTSGPRSIDDLLAAPVPPARRAPVASDGSAPQTGGTIASLLADGDGPTRTGSTGPTGPDAIIASAQRALDALGYGPLTADGLYGPMTRGAIERFERDQGLTVTGQLVPATAQSLAREAGTAIE